MHEEIDETAANSGFDDGLNFVVRPVGEVRNGPASIDKDFVVKRVDEFCQYAKCRGNLNING